MTDYPVPEKRETIEWRFEDGGLLAGPYSYNELQEYVDLGYIQPETKVIHEDGRKFQAFEVGLFPGFVPVKTVPADKNENTITPLPGWNFLAAVIGLLIITAKIAMWMPNDHWFRAVLPFTKTLGGFVLVLLSCYTCLTGIAHSFWGTPRYRPVFYRIGALIGIYLGFSLVVTGLQDFR